MTLQRVSIPSPNHGGVRSGTRLLVVHTSEGAQTFRSLGNFLANPNAKVSYHVGFDNNDPNVIGNYVNPAFKSWSAHAANSVGEHGCCCTPSGASRGWSRAIWLAHPKMLEACRRWLMEEAIRYQIPLKKISGNDIRNGAKGVCGHADCVAAGLGGTHVDPGPNFPWDVVLRTGASEADLPLNEADKAWIGSEIQRVTTATLRSEGVSGARAGATSSVDESVINALGPKLDQIIDLLSK